MYRQAALALALLAAPSLADIGYEYLEDDGVSSVTLGPPTSFEEFGDIDMLWGNYYFTNEPTELVTEVLFGLGSLSAGEQVHVWIFDDPDDDADPTNAVPVFNMTVTGANLGFDFNTLAIPGGVEVGGGFFVAVGHLAELTYPAGSPDYPSPARFDPDGRADRSWFFYDDDIPETDLASSGFVSRMDGKFVPIQGAFAVRAHTVCNSGCNEADLAQPFGVFDFSDVVAFLSAFGAMDPAADLAAPFGSYDFSDVVSFLGAFGAGCP